MLLCSVRALFEKLMPSLFVRFFLLTDDRSKFLLVVEKSTQPHAQHTGDPDQRRQRRQLLILFNAVDPDSAQPRTFGYFFDRQILHFAKVSDFSSNNLVCIHDAVLLVAQKYVFFGIHATVT